LTELIQKGLERSISYQEYSQLIGSLLHEGKTTGSIQTEDYIHYTTMNKVRMDRLDKTTKVLPETELYFSTLDRPLLLLTLTEAWCGDAAQVIPVIEKMASLSELAETRYILRDEHPMLMEHFLTDGGRSIPKVIALDQRDKTVLGSWGPRPKEVQDMVQERKAAALPMPYSEFSVIVQKWYAKDRTVSIQREFLAALKSWF
jgi:hypothetical protein